METNNRIIPNWRNTDTYKEQEALAEQRRAEVRAAQVANPPAWALAMLPPGDPKALRAKWEIINPGVPYPEDGQ